MPDAPKHPVTERRLFVTPEEYQAQRDANWPDFHPEMYCQKCYSRNIESWYVDNPIWNTTDLRPSMIVCPQCLTEAYQEAIGQSVTWEIRLAQRPDDTLRDAVLAILEGNPHASKEYLAHRITIEVTDREAAHD